MKLGMKHQGIKSTTLYLNGDPEMTLTSFTARSFFFKLGILYGGNVTMMDSLEIIADLMYCLSLPYDHV